jgi:type I restriction enzyme, S subunit
VENHQKTKIGKFLFERKGKYKPDDERISGLKRISKIDFSGNFHIAQKPSKTNMILIKSGDLVVSGINVSKGAMGIYYGDEDVVATIHYSSYTFDSEKINVEYFKRFLKSAKFINLLKEQVKGGIKTEIKPKHILPLEIDLPIIEDQEKIVSHLKSIENEDDELKQEIINQQTLLKKLRQQILQEAIEGKLTKDWRVENPNVEPARELLKRIKTEKEQLIKEKKIKKQKQLPPITEKDKLFELPEKWEWCRLDELIYESPRNGFSPKSVNYETEIKNLKLGATTKGYFDETVFKFVDIEIRENSYLWLKPRDILIQRGNSIDFVGVSAIFKSDGRYIYPDLMMKLQPSKFVAEIYLHHTLLSPFNRNYFRDNASGAQKTMPKINQGTVSQTLIPFPPITEQKAIVKKVEKLFAICDKLVKEINENKIHSEQLMQAVLTEAFEGESK